VGQLNTYKNSQAFAMLGDLPPREELLLVADCVYSGNLHPSDVLSNDLSRLQSSLAGQLQLGHIADNSPSGRQSRKQKPRRSGVCV